MLDIEKTIQEMTIAEKVSLLAGRDFWHTVPIKRLDIPAVRVSQASTTLCRTYRTDV